MRAIGAILGAIAGAVLGYIGAFVIGYPIIVAMDGPDRDGGIAMGVAVTLGPAMAVITALIFLLLILRLTRPKKPQTIREPDPAEDPDEALLRAPPGTNPGRDTQTLIAIGVVVVLVVSGILWLNGG
ncbi:hypothetical protein [uncultured Roseibium sp.]|uniref:hypothetical protein n=1 Tax=uncultured Roseibium sp. TaxID=1936171 RepID=UPI0032167552